MQAIAQFYFPVTAAILRLRVRPCSRMRAGLSALLSGIGTPAASVALEAERAAHAETAEDLRQSRAALRRAEQAVAERDAKIARLRDQLATARALYAAPREVDRRSKALMDQIAAQRSAAEIPSPRERRRLARETRRGERLEGGLR